MRNKILITGATGPTGKSAMAGLLTLNIPVRALVHSIDERSEALKQDGVEVVQGDLTDFNSVSAAMKGISAAYFVFPVTGPGILEATAYFVQAALEEKVGHIVNMSQRTSRRDTKSHGAQNHWIAERVFDKSGIPVTHLQPTLFDEWTLYFSKEIREHDRLISPFGKATYASIAGEDIGRVIAAVLANPEPHKGKTYPLFGPEELSQTQVAGILSDVLQRKITYAEMDIPAFSEILRPFSTPYFVQHIAAVAQDFRDGLLEGTNNIVEEITGQRPMTMREFLIKNIRVLQNH